MYGLLIEAIVHYIKENFGESVWLDVRKVANIQQVSFSTHERYSENLVPNIGRALSQITGCSYNDLMDAFGVCFVSFVGQYGYDRILKVLGRHMTDFLNGLDNLHEYLRFSYPKLRPPSFFVEEETTSGLTLHYRSKRKGYVHYVKGQIRQVGALFYNTKVDIDVISEEETDTMTHVVMKLHFDNTAYKVTQENKDDFSVNLPLNADVFFELFPFHIVFNEHMEVRSAGNGLRAVFPDMVGQTVTDVFTIVLPLVPFSWFSILAHTNNAFELLSTKCVSRYHDTEIADDLEPPLLDRVPKRKTPGSRFETAHSTVDQEKDVDESGMVGYAIHLKGQMMYMPEWESIIFLGTPIMESLDIMFKTGLYINDLSMHDSSRDLVLAGTQQSAELKLALDQEQKKSKILQESMLKLDAEMKRTDSLLYQMIPKQVADRLRSGEPAISTCEVFENVTILFSDVVGFTRICSQISPMEVVSMLNAMYTKFDQLSEQHNVYKVETIGDAYMVVSGAPDKTRYHALHICDMSLDMLDAMNELRDPSTDGNMKIRVGVHSGNTVAGVVGIKMPRYCLFGDTVNTASRMETNGQANKIHISETTRQELIDYPYILEERGTVTVKGKGQMKTYWLLGRDPVESTQAKCPFGSILLEELSKVKSKNEDIFTSSKSGGLNDQADFAELRSLYSPVSFEDVKKTMSNNASPKDSPAKKTNLSPRLHRHGKNNNHSEGTASQASNEHCPVKDKSMFIIRKNDLRKPGERNKMYDYQNTSKTCQLL
ncbi:soluble guanylate cyclase 88E-like isoform X2 [Ruditapes philippinarum]|nr:soluble guanylate cyclase 88E-like isoform X2 [Ruditapes philippinarum]XP_060566943.1 soluble guanylate cyclase 88E-like isoform X2 [Ruditapes philippinarum]XP_060566944.1 soluble guanylate cyclase 88E-like isoform X2 [Ruditapes philippinarum]XP_060566945.1 soluble guanylate cyclase 88E-like isoform X2 [Ruditapes philippinarum]